MNYKFLIILFYYNRPNMVRNALISLKHSNLYYSNWKLLFIDDGSPLSDEKILYDILGKFGEKIEYINTNTTETEKMELGGSLIGKFANEEMKKMECDYSIMLCDDDAIYPDYLYNLNKYYNKHPEDVYTYSHVLKYNPKVEMFWDAFDNNPDRNNLPFDLNKYTEPINPYQRLDASQISWNIRKIIENGVGFKYPQTLNLDAALYKQLHEKFGDCKYNGYIGQFKGDYDDTLSLRQWNPNMYQLNSL